MGERAEQIMDEIEHQRQELGDNLHELEAKVKDTMDWRSQFEQHPMVGLGVAFASGFLLSAMLPGGGSDGESRSSSDMANYRVYDESHGWRGSTKTQQFAPEYSSPLRSKQPSPEMREINETVENIRGAVMGLAATRLKSFLSESVPGFKEEYESARQKRGNSDATRIPDDYQSGMRSDGAREAATTGFDQSSSTSLHAEPRQSGSMDSYRV